MNDDFQRTMDEAARLVRGGSLREATAAIQRALGGQPSPRGGPVTATATATVDRDVIDVEARVIADPESAPDATVRARPESYVAGHFRNECGTRDYKLFEPARADARPLPLVVLGAWHASAAVKAALADRMTP